MLQLSPHTPMKMSAWMLSWMENSLIVRQVCMATEDPEACAREEGVTLR